jgi:hypothetical protein
LQMRSTAMMPALRAACATMSLLASLARADADPFIGTWVLRAEVPALGAPEQSLRMQIVMQPAEHGTHYKSKTTHPNRQVTTAEYTADYDGHPAMVLGDSGLLLPVSLTRIDVHTVEVKYMRGFQVVAQSHRVISPDGKTMTITTTSKGPDGGEVTNTGTYAKVSGGAPPM